MYIFLKAERGDMAVEFVITNPTDLLSFIRYYS